MNRRTAFGAIAAGLTATQARDVLAAISPRARRVAPLDDFIEDLEGLADQLQDTIDTITSNPTLRDMLQHWIDDLWDLINEAKGGDS